MPSMSPFEVLWHSEASPLRVESSKHQELFPPDLPNLLHAHTMRLQGVEDQILTVEVEQEGEWRATITVEPVEA